MPHPETRKKGLMCQSMSLALIINSTNALPWGSHKIRTLKSLDVQALQEWHIPPTNLSKKLYTTALWQLQCKSNTLYIVETVFIDFLWLELPT